MILMPKQIKAAKSQTKQTILAALVILCFAATISALILIVWNYSKLSKSKVFDLNEGELEFDEIEAQKIAEYFKRDFQYAKDFEHKYYQKFDHILRKKPEIICQSNEFKCLCGTCINIDKLCDSVTDCDNGEDEEPNFCFKHNPACDSSAFRCNNGKCISAAFICDEETDCAGGEDEANCHCSKDQFRCNNGKCIPKAISCDGQIDCDGGDDELNCPSNSSSIKSSLQWTKCLPNEFTCNNGKCINRYGICDEANDCDDGEDEEQDICYQRNKNCDIYSVPSSDSNCTTNFGICYEEIECDKEENDVTCRNRHLIQIHPKNVQIHSGDSLLLTCKSPVDRNATVSWLKQGHRQLPENVIINRNILAINNVSSVDSAVYYCIISLSKPLKNIKSTIESSNVIVLDTQKPKINPNLSVISTPYITIKPNSKNITIKDGDKFELVCSAEGSPLAKIEWQRMDGTSVQNIQSSSGNSVSVQVHNATIKDKGVYMCLARNDQGQSMGYITVLYHLRPLYVDNVFEGNGITLWSDSDPEIAIRNKDVPTPTWWRRQDGQPLPKNSKVMGKELIFEFLKKEDGGIYEMHGPNENYPVFRSQINVIEHLKITFEHEVSFVPLGNAFRFYCNVTGDTPIRIEWHREDRDSFRSNVRVVGRFLLFSRVTNGNAGRYECIAHNNFERVTKTVELKVIEDEDSHCDFNDYSCIASYCILYKTRCEGFEKCPYGDYEKHCDKYCLKNEFTCKDHSCIPRSKICDGVDDCDGGEDETVGCSYASSLCHTVGTC